jgi:predicted acylesterase/phospholipase RssA
LLASGCPKATAVILVRYELAAVRSALRCTKDSLDFATENMVRSKKTGLAIYAGGNHVFYIIGVLKRFIEKGLKFEAVATYSSGSAILPFLIDNNFQEAPEIFGERLDRNERNFYPTHLFTGEDVFPHDHIYSSVISDTIDFNKATEYEKPLRVIVSEFESRGSADAFIGILALIAMTLNSVSRTSTPSVFLRLFKTLFSISGDIVDIRKSRSKEEIADVILGSSTIYPFIRIRRRAGRSMLDGKVCLISPVEALDDCEHVLSIHAHHSFLPQREGLTSLFPISKVSVGPLNYVGSAGIKSAFAQGYEEAEQHYARLSHSAFFSDTSRDSP